MANPMITLPNGDIAHAEHIVRVYIRDSSVVPAAITMFSDRGCATAEFETQSEAEAAMDAVQDQLRRYWEQREAEDSAGKPDPIVIVIGTDRFATDEEFAEQVKASIIEQWRRAIQ